MNQFNNEEQSSQGDPSEDSPEEQANQGAEASDESPSIADAPVSSEQSPPKSEEESTPSETSEKNSTSETEETQEATEQPEAETEASDESSTESTSEPSIEEMRSAAEEEEDEQEEIDIDLDKFRGFSILNNLGPDELRTLLKHSNQKTVSSGTTIFEEGTESSDSFYLILGGELAVTKMMRGKEKTVNVEKEGDLVGEFGLFTGNERMATIKANTAAEILEVTQEAIDELQREHPRALVTIYENLFQDLAEEFQQLAQKAEKSQFWL
ncbi:MAG: Crp/Fnr family transcriptional regulator [bacterium]